MRSANPLAGSATDRLLAIVGQVKSLRDGPDAVFKFSSLQRGLESVILRVDVVRHRGGCIHGLAAAAGWLRSAIEASPALAEPAAEGLRAELLRLVDRCRGGG